MEKKRILTITVVLALAVLAAASSWIVGSRIQSPAEAAARTAPPEPAPILVPVEERVLTADVVTRGTARFGAPQVVALVPSPLKPTTGVITSLPPAGARYEEGDVLLTVSGRPVFVVQGTVPAYRDFLPGTSGDDVRQLEEALDRLGHDPGPVDGVYDAQTGAAVSAWYAAAGWSPFAATAEQEANLRAREQELVVALNRMEEAEAVTATAVLAVSAAEAEAAAADRLAAATVAAATTETERELAQAQALATQLAGELAVQQALDAQNAAQRAARLAAAAVNQRTIDVNTAREAAGVKVPLDEILFVPSLPLRIDDNLLALGDEARGPGLVVTNELIVVDSSLPLDEAGLVLPGMAVMIDEPDLGIDTGGTVSQVADTPGTAGLDGYHVYFTVQVDEAETSLVGVSLRLTIPVETTTGPVLVVPISALSLAPDGSSRIQVEQEDGSLDYLTVNPGLSADGFVEITLLEGTITPGQLVVIGFQ